MSHCTIATHSGSFHTDDVFAVATIQLLQSEGTTEIIRTRDATILDQADYVVDVGEIYDPQGHRYDHHQADAPVRDNGIPYSAFGLVWREFGSAIAGNDDLADWFDKHLVQVVDAGDNGLNIYQTTHPDLEPFTLDHVIDSFRPRSGTKSTDEAFLEAVAFAKQLIINQLEQEQAAIHMRNDAEHIYQSYPDKTVLTTTHPISPDAFAHLPDVLVVVKPRTKDENSDWIARVIPEKAGSIANRAHFPASWAGLRDEELVSISGITDAVFCHKQRYLFVAHSQAGALAAAQAITAAKQET